MVVRLRRNLSLLIVVSLLSGAAASSACARRVTSVPPSLSVTTSPAPETTSASNGGTARWTGSTRGVVSTDTAGAPMTFAVIGDYGVNDMHERAVAKLVKSWNPEFVVSVGDGYYSGARGGSAKYARSTGALYGEWLPGSRPLGGPGSGNKPSGNAFFPVLGNHDYSDASGPGTYVKYFDLPGSGFKNSSGNERFYDFVQGPVHFFALNSNAQEPYGTSSTSIQAQWLRKQLAASGSRWNIVYMHHPPYSSDVQHGSTAGLQWPFRAWGADAVVSGHAHTYERVMRDGIPYFVNGLGGARRYNISTPVPGSAVRYQADWGAQKVTVTDAAIVFEFYDVRGKLVDRHRLSAEPATPATMTP